MKNQLAYLIVFTLFSSFSFAENYSPEFKQSFTKYKQFSPKKKKRLKNKWNSFKEKSNWEELSAEEKRKIKLKILKKNSL